MPREGKLVKPKAVLLAWVQRMGRSLWDQAGRGSRGPNQKWHACPVRQLAQTSKIMGTSEGFKQGNVLIRCLQRALGIYGVHLSVTEFPTGRGQDPLYYSPRCMEGQKLSPGPLGTPILIWVPCCFSKRLPRPVESLVLIRRWGKINGNYIDLAFLWLFKELIDWRTSGSRDVGRFPSLTYSFFQVLLKHHFLLEALPGLTSLPKQESSRLLSIYSVWYISICVTLNILFTTIHCISLPGI